MLNLRGKELKIEAILITTLIFCLLISTLFLIQKTQAILKREKINLKFCDNLQEIKANLDKISYLIEPHLNDREFMLEFDKLLTTEINILLVKQAEAWLNFQPYLKGENKKNLQLTLQDFSNFNDINRLYNYLYCEQPKIYKVILSLVESKTPNYEINWPNKLQQWEKTINAIVVVLPKIKAQISQDEKTLCQSSEMFASVKKLNSYLKIHHNIQTSKSLNNNYSQRQPAQINPNIKIDILYSNQEKILRDNWSKYITKWGLERPQPICLSGIENINQEL